MSSPRVYHWLCLLGAIVFEVAGTTLMKLSQGWTWAFAPQTGLAGMLALIGLSYYLLSRSTMGIPVGVAFAFWEGLGLTMITVASVLVLGEPMHVIRFLALCAVLAGALLIHHGTGQGAEHRNDAEQSPGAFSARDRRAIGGRTPEVVRQGRK